MGDALAIFATAIGIIGLTGGAVGFFAKGRGDAIIAYQEKENRLLKDSVAGLEKSNAALTAEKDSLLRENATLKNLAQGSPQLQKLTSALERHTKAVTNLMKGLKK